MQLKDGTMLVQTISDHDSFGNAVSESYSNGVNTLWAFDPTSGRLQDIDTRVGGNVLQDNKYSWRSNGTLEHRTATAGFG